MSEHLTGEEIARYRARRSATDEIARVQDHADECAECRGRLALRGAAASLRAVLNPEPDEQELVRFVAGQLPALRAAEIAGHLERCARCMAVVDDLRQFAQPPVRLPEPTPAMRTHRVRWSALAAAVVLAAGLGWWLNLRHGAVPPELASLNDRGAGRLALLASGEVTGIAGLDPQERAWVSQALRAAHLPSPENPWAAPQGGVLRGPELKDGFRLLAPVDTRVLSERPEFRWEALPGAGSYQVTVFTEDEQVVAQSGSLTATEWQPGAPLPRQRKLAWQVTARRGAETVTEPSPPQPRAFFEAVPAAAAARIEAVQGTPTPSHLLLAALYAHEGLGQQAARELALLAERNPGSPLVKRLQESLAQSYSRSLETK
jgi:hypothetical protein